MKRKQEDVNIEIFRRYLNDSYSREDLDAILSWFGEPGNDVIRRITMKSLWAESCEKDPSMTRTSYVEDQMLDSIHHRINSLESIPRRIKRQPGRSRSLFSTFSRIAAVLFLPLLITSVLYINQKTNIILPDAELEFAELHAPPFARISFFLDDSTKVWLNNGSRLEYPKSFSGRDRRVFLQGEAFFDVKKDPSQPFIVETGELGILVLGTRFNISNYDDEGSIVTTLEEGKLQIRTAGQGKKSQVLHELEPSKQSIFRKESRDIQIRTVNTDKYTSWKEGKLFLQDDPLPVVKTKLERWYNVKVVIKDQEISDYRYTGTFHQEPLEKVLRMMAMATPIRYEIRKGSKLEDNTYSKDTVIIRKKK